MDQLFEVFFSEYCKHCFYANTDENQVPCDECLSCPANENSHKPINFKEKE